jgi:hypothetical protein
MTIQEMRHTLTLAKEQIERAEKQLDAGHYTAVSAHVLSAKAYLGHVYAEADKRVHRARTRSR